VPSVRRLRADEWSAYRELRLRALGDAPNAFGSTVEREASRPDEEWQRRVADGAASRSDLPLVLVEQHRLLGLAWGKILPGAPDVAHLFQMWVAPEVRGRGHGSDLVDGVVEWARSAGAAKVVLRVTEGDTAARRLYAKAGFASAGALEPLRPGSDLWCRPMELDLRDPSDPWRRTDGPP